MSHFVVFRLSFHPGRHYSVNKWQESAISCWSRRCRAGEMSQYAHVGFSHSFYSAGSANCSNKEIPCAVVKWNRHISWISRIEWCTQAPATASIIIRRIPHIWNGFFVPGMIVPTAIWCWRNCERAYSEAWRKQGRWIGYPGATGGRTCVGAQDRGCFKYVKSELWTKS